MPRPYIWRIDLYTPPSLCFAEGDGSGSGDGSGGGGGNGAAGNGEGGETTPTAAPNWTEFTDGLTRLNETMGGKLDNLISEVQSVNAATPAPRQEPVDLEAMSRPELVAHIVGTISEAVKAQIADALNPFAEQLNGLQHNVVTRTVEQEIATLRSSNKDFDDWKAEMVGLAKQHPTLGIPQLYRLARVENPAKAGELDKKYAPPAPKPTPRFGGLLDTGRSSGASPPLSAKDAGIEAYREVAARHPGILAALENM